MTIVTLPAFALRSDLSNFSAPPGSAERLRAWPLPAGVVAGAEAAVVVAGAGLPPLWGDALSLLLEPQPAANSAAAPRMGISLCMNQTTPGPADPSPEGRNRRPTARNRHGHR